MIDTGSKTLDTIYMSKISDTDAQITCQHIKLTGPHVRERKRHKI